MRLVFHPRVAADIARIMSYYDEVAGPQLADEFYSELQSFFTKAAKAPETYSIRARDLRRVNLERFPYHFLFRIAQDHVRILVIRHHNRHPSLGLRRR
jgi:plasmid stabilization system protein ParE